MSIEEITNELRDIRNPYRQECGEYLGHDYGVDNSIAFLENHSELIKTVNNHDRLVEALEQVVADIHTGNYGFGEHMLDEWEQLLTELKQQ